MEKRKSTDSVPSSSSLAASVPDELVVPDPPQMPSKRRKDMASTMAGLADTLKSLSQEIDWNTKDLLGRIRLIRDENVTAMQMIAQMENRLKTCENKLAKSFVAASTLVPASASGHASISAVSKPAAINTSANTRPTAGSGHTPTKPKVDIPVIDDWDAPFCPKCNEDHPACVGK